MIDNRLLALLHNIEHNSESLETLSVALTEETYKDILVWYATYTGATPTCCYPNKCAELIFYLFKHDNFDLYNMENFVRFKEVLCSKYGIRSKDVFSFLQDYRELVLD